MLLQTWASALVPAATLLLGLTGHAEGGLLFPRGKAISDDSCLDIDNADPLPLRYGYPSWRTADDPNCQPFSRVDSEGHCFGALAPDNDCNAFCKLTDAWFYGEPIDAMDGRFCEIGQPCTKSVAISKMNGDSTTINSGTSYQDDTVRSNSSESKDSTAISMGVSMDPGISATLPVPGISINIGSGIHNKWDSTFSRSRTQAWSRTIKESKTFGILNQTTFSVNIAETDTLTKPAYASNYCGSWFAVPVVGILCGRGAYGELVINEARQESACALKNQYESSFSHCFYYTFRDWREQDMTKYRMAFVLRDCEHGFILPGEWQPAAFRNSFAPEVYHRQHIDRYGYSNLPSNWPKKPDDAAWVQESQQNPTFRKTIGPEDHTIKVCGPGGYCVRYKLTDGNCCMFFSLVFLFPSTQTDDS